MKKKILENILEPLKDLDYQELEDISSDLCLSDFYERKAVGRMLHRAIIYLINEDLKEMNI